MFGKVLEKKINFEISEENYNVQKSVFMYILCLGFKQYTERIFEGISL